MSLLVMRTAMQAEGQIPQQPGAEFLGMPNDYGYGYGGYGDHLGMGHDHEENAMEALEHLNEAHGHLDVAHEQLGPVPSGNAFSAPPPLARAPPPPPLLPRARVALSSAPSNSYEDDGNEDAAPALAVQAAGDVLVAGRDDRHGEGHDAVVDRAIEEAMREPLGPSPAALVAVVKATAGKEGPAGGKAGAGAADEAVEEEDDDDVHADHRLDEAPQFVAYSAEGYDPVALEAADAPADEGDAAPAADAPYAFDDAYGWLAADADHQPL